MEELRAKHWRHHFRCSPWQRAVSWPLCHGLYGWPGTAFQKEELAVTPEAVKWGEHQAAVTLRTDSAGRSSVPLGILFV